MVLVIIWVLRISPLREVLIEASRLRAKSTSVPVSTRATALLPSEYSNAHSASAEAKGAVLPVNAFSVAGRRDWSLQSNVVGARQPRLSEATFSRHS